MCLKEVSNAHQGCMFVFYIYKLIISNTADCDTENWSNGCRKCFFVITEINYSYSGNIS